MKLTTREIVLLIFVLFLAAGVGYYFLYYTPLSKDIAAAKSDIERKETELIAAQTRASNYASMVAARDELKPVAEGYRESLPVTFSDLFALVDLQNIIYPHTRTVSISFPAAPAYEATDREAGGSRTLSTVMYYPLALNFSVPMDGLLDILRGFDKLEPNLIENYTLSQAVSEDGDIVYSVSMTVNYIVQKIAESGNE